MAVGQPTSILVVDDDPFMRSTTEISLRSRGFTILQAGNGQEGLDMFRVHSPDLLIVDLKMPVMNGLELLSRLSDVTGRIPVLVISGEGGLDEALEALRRGAWDYLVKPIASPSVLMHAVDKALERAALIQENEDYRNNLERQVKERTRELQKANRELELQFLKQQKLGIIGTLAGGMAHDFNNILSSIVFSAELIPGATTVGESPDQEDLERIVRVCQRGTALIRSILHFTGKMHEEFIHFPISETLTEALDIIRGTTPSRIEIVPDIGQNLGTLFGDPVHLQQIVMNLFTNSIHTLSDTDHPRIDIRAQIHSGAHPDILLKESDTILVTITVTDNGAGIDEADIARVCEPFFTTKSRDEGTGLGLFVIQKIVKNMRGTLRIFNIPGGGTAVRICLPASPVNTGTELDSPANRDIRGTGELILVMESDRYVRKMLCAHLEQLGYQTRQAESIPLGLDVFLNQPAVVDLVLAESATPSQIDDLCCRIHGVNPATRIILTSTTLSFLARNPPGVCRTIPKPINFPSLGRIIRNCLTQCHVKI